jgi:hypothetical protein
MIGRIGQSELSTWAPQAGITCNPSFHDDRGWDALLQLPASVGANEDGPMDRAPPEISCMVQVKTTTTAEQSVPISLSNWRRMVREPMPWFVLAVHLDENERPSRAYLVHVDENWCRKVLKRLRELDSQGHHDLNHHTLDVSWDENDRLAELHGRALDRCIRACVLPDQHQYVIEKIRWFGSLGYDDPTRTVSITFKSENSDIFWNHIAEIGIGVRSTYPGEWRARISDVRFGIPGTLTEFGRESGEMEYPPQSQGSVDFELYSQTGTRRAKTTCEIYRAASIFPFIPAKYDRFRMVGEYFECIMGVAARRRIGAQFSMNIPPEAPVFLSAFQILSEIVLLILEQPKNSVCLRINGHEIPGFLPADIGASEESTRQMFEIIDSALKVYHSFGLVAENAADSVTLSSLIEQSEVIQFLANSLKPELGMMTVPFPRPVQPGKLFGCVVVYGLQLEQKTLIAAMGYYGFVATVEERAGYGARMTADKTSVIFERYIIDNSKLDTFDTQLAQASVERRLLELGCDAVCVHGRK